MRLCIYPAWNSKPNQFQFRVIVLAICFAACRNNSPFHGTDTRVKVYFGGQGLCRELILRNMRKEFLCIYKYSVSANGFYNGYTIIDHFFSQIDYLSHPRMYMIVIHTFFDTDGHLIIIDRAKDVGRLADGSLFAPKYIENKLKFFPFIKEAVAFGDGREACNAFINIDMEAVGNWAERRNLPYTGYTDLASQSAVYALIAECVEKVNADLAHDTLLAGSQIHRFLILHKELDPDDDELTRTRKVRRRFIAEKYAVLIDALYAGKARQYIETQVKFEDGRQGMISADLEIRNVNTVAPARKAA